MNLYYEKLHKDDDHLSLNLWTIQKLRDKVREINTQISLEEKWYLEDIKTNFLILC